MPNIVVLNVSTQQAPAPLTYQETGAFISQGGTSLAAGSTSLLTGSGSLTSLLASPLAISSIAWSGGTASVSTSATIPGLTDGDVFITTLAGVTPAGFNGTYLATVTGGNTFTFPLATNPGSVTVPGTYSPPNQGELIAMNQTYWGQGAGQSVYVLELGPADGTTGPGLLSTWIAAHPGIFYSYLVPRDWDAQTGYLELVNQFTAPSAKTYFFTTTTTSNYAAYAGIKSVLWIIEAPSTQAGGSRPLTEFSAAAFFQTTLNYAPSATNKQTQLNYGFLYGVTPYPTFGNQALLNEIAAANGSVVGTGAEGGLSNTIVRGGTTADGNPFTYWYSADWAQLQIDQAVSNAVINGSNNPQSPLYYNQFGINTLQDVIVSTCKSGVSFGLALGPVARASLTGDAFTAALAAGTYEDEIVVNAIPFTPYTQANPANYGKGIYGGFSVQWIPQLGFDEIIINLNVTDLLG